MVETTSLYQTIWRISDIWIDITPRLSIQELFGLDNPHTHNTQRNMIINLTTLLEKLSFLMVKSITNPSQFNFWDEFGHCNISAADYDDTQNLSQIVTICDGQIRCYVHDNCAMTFGCCYFYNEFAMNLVVADCDDKKNSSQITMNLWRSNLSLFCENFATVVGRLYVAKDWWLIWPS